MYIPIEGWHDMPNAPNLAEWFRNKYDTVINAACQHEVLNAYTLEGEKVFHSKYNHYLHSFKPINFSEIEAIRIGRYFEISNIWTIEYLDPAQNDSSVVLSTTLVGLPKIFPFGSRNEYDLWITFKIYSFEENSELNNQLAQLRTESKRIDSIIEWISLDIQRNNIEYYGYGQLDKLEEVEPQFQPYHMAIKGQTSKLLELLDSIKQYHVAIVRDSDI
ncbi:MAG: hypothetical protein HWE24_00550 [Oceanospirillaceae bacterium]|nr:hypothetical protein [Oceanospirillaceae bacterium]